MDLAVEGRDLAWILLACVLLGGLGGIAFDLTEPVNPLRRRRSKAEGSPDDAVPGSSEDEGFGDNRLILPRVSGSRGRRSMEAGFLGPIFVGSLAAVLAVFTLAVDRPAAPSTIERDGVVATLKKQHVSSAAVTALDNQLRKSRTAFVSWFKLIPIGLIAGFAGVAVLRRARAKILAAIGAVSFEARKAGIREGVNVAKTALQEQPFAQTESPATKSVTQVLTSACEQHVRALESSSPYGNPAFE